MLLPFRIEVEMLADAKFNQNKEGAALCHSSVLACLISLQQCFLLIAVLWAMISRWRVLLLPCCTLDLHLI
jgi:hypothetical protein